MPVQILKKTKFKQKEMDLTFLLINTKLIWCAHFAALSVYKIALQITTTNFSAAIFTNEKKKSCSCLIKKKNKAFMLMKNR